MTLATTCNTAYAETVFTPEQFTPEQFTSEQISLKQFTLEPNMLNNIKEKVMVGGYECWNVNEQYFTVNDLGEICQVIDLNQMEWTPVENNSEAVAMFSLRSGRNEVDVSGDNTYSGTIDATQSDYTTPVFTGWTLNDPYSNIYPDERISYVIRCDDFVFSRQHLAEIHIYNDVEGEFLLGNTTNLVFSTFIKTAYLVNGAWNNAPTKIYVTFPKGDGNKKVTNYSVYTKTKKY